MDKALYGDLNPESASDVIEGRLIQIAARTLTLGVSVVLDFGLWSRDERTALRQLASEVDAAVQLVFCLVDPAEQRRRLQRRLVEDPHTTWFVPDDELAGYASIFQRPSSGELDGSEPIDAPPAGFPSWADWRALRWYPTVP